MYPGTVTCLQFQLKRRLKEVGVKSHQFIKTIEALQSLVGIIAVISHQPTHHRPVLLLYMGIIILLVGARAGEFNAFPLAVVVEPMVYELRAIIRVQTQPKFTTNRAARGQILEISALNEIKVEAEGSM